MALIGSGILGLHAAHQSDYVLSPVMPQPIAQQSTMIEFFNRTEEKYKNRDFRGAITDYTKAIANNLPEDAKTYNNRGVSFSASKDCYKAIADFNKAIAINPEYADAYYNRGFAYAQAGNMQQAKQDLKTAAPLFRRQGNLSTYEDIIQLLQYL
jgi:tetratricopeptide (TPR) repeat protein